MRHGEAEATAASDFDRHLTAVGRAQVAASMKALLARGIVPDCIFASGLVRAQETARIAVEHARLSRAVVTWDILAPDGTPHDVLVRLEPIAGSTLLISHQPLVGRLILYMCGTETAMPTAAIACIRFRTPARGSGRLEWLQAS